MPISPRDPAWGSRLAPVTIVEFADLQCPFSRRVQSTLKALRESYGPETLRIVWKNDPLAFHQDARPAAEAAMGVFALSGNDAFWKFHDLAFENQASLKRDDFLKWAQDAGVRDILTYAAGLDNHRWAYPVDEALHEASTLGVSGTPAFYVNGVYISGAQPLATFTKTVEEELAKAQAQLEKGTPADQLYSRVAAENRTAAKADKAKADKAKDDDDDADRARIYKVPLGKSPVRGSAEALVTIVEFADFQCPFSGRVQGTLRALQTKYGDKIRLVWKNQPLPFHKAAEPAAEAALEVRAERGDAAFWDMHDKLFASQKDLTLNDASPNLESIADLAAAAGASRARVKAAMIDRTHKKEILADQEVADDFKASGTPHFFINGRRLVGAQPQEKFEKLIDEEIAKAQDLVTRGVKPGALYATITKDGSGPIPPETKEVPKGLPAGDPALGNPKAKVTVHEWADFQCPFCKREEPAVQQVIHEYGGKIRFVWHDLPLSMHPEARPAARAAREAFEQKGAAGFWAMHDKLFASQDHLQRADLDGYATELHLDANRWAAALDGDAHESEVEADAKAARDGGINSTPSFLIVSGSATRGYYISGAQDYRRFRSLIERALAEASP